MTDVEVYLAGDDDQPVGTLYPHRRRGSESASFGYAASYLASSAAYAIDPVLPLASGTHQTRVGQAMFGALSDSAPDRWGRTLITRGEAQLARAEGRAARSIAEIDYLLGVRDDLRQGALRFRAGSGPFLAEADAGVPALTDLPVLLDLAARAEADTADLADLRRLIRAGSSLGGARPKAHVRDTNGAIAIAKFPSESYDTWNVMAWEKVALDLAGRAGIDVPRSQLLNIAGRHVLVVDRFDRGSDGARIGYVSAMTMLEASDGDRRSYLDIAEVIEGVSARATAELHALWRRIVFSVLISNTDDHLRNHGFLHQRGDAWRLSPAFDLNPNPQPGPKFLTTSIDSGDDAASLAAAVSVADFFRLTPTMARDVIAAVAAAVAQWPVVATGHGLAKREVDAMRPAFAALDSLPLI
jgi:serine/threonine-protein kinase HipA